jgi:predicted  nucleic acid-binding Zn-ribbon protein
MEELEARISILREDSRMCTYRINFHSERRQKIQQEIKELKEKINEQKRTN